MDGVCKQAIFAYTFSRRKQKCGIPEVYKGVRPASSKIVLDVRQPWWAPQARPLRRLIAPEWRGQFVHLRVDRSVCLVSGGRGMKSLPASSRSRRG